MKTAEFAKEIKAPAQKVWDVLWNSATYQQWTQFFNPNGASYMQTDWKVGGRTLFTDDKGNGMISTIRSVNEPYDVVFEHRGEIADGKEDTTSEKVQSWAGSLEEYHLSEDNGLTTLRASVQMDEEWADHLSEGFVKGLEVIKSLAEAESIIS